MISGDLLVRMKMILNSTLGYLGLSIAAFIETISFHESNLFKAVLATSGLILGLITIYSIYLDVKIKKKQLKSEESHGTDSEE